MCFSNETAETDEREIFEIGHCELGKIRNQNLNTVLTVFFFKDYFFFDVDHF